MKKIFFFRLLPWSKTKSREKREFKHLFCSQCAHERLARSWRGGKERGKRGAGARLNILTPRCGGRLYAFNASVESEQDE